MVASRQTGTPSSDLVAKIASGLAAAKSAKKKARKANKSSKADARAQRISSAVGAAVKAVQADTNSEYTSLLGKAEIAQAAGDRPLAAGYRAKAAAIKAAQ